MAEQADVAGAAIGQAAGREEQRQRIAIDHGTRLRRAARIGDIFGVTDRAVIDRGDAAARQWNDGKSRNQAFGSRSACDFRMIRHIARRWQSREFEAQKIAMLQEC